MQPQKIDLTIYKGSTFRNTFVWQSVVDGVEVPVNISGCSIRMAIARSKRAEEPYIFLTTQNQDIVIVDEEAGAFYVEIDADTTASFSWQKAIYDIEIIFPNSDVFRIVEGEICAEGEVTRWH